MEESIKIYGVVGGIPLYLNFFRKNKDTLELKEDILIEDKVSKAEFNKVENDFLKIQLQKALKQKQEEKVKNKNSFNTHHKEITALYRR